MSEDQIGRVQDLFIAALDIPMEQRDAWLEVAAGGDQALLAEVRELLHHDQPTSDPLERGFRY